jgi:hypothetical protein
MKEEYFKWYHQILNKDMEMLVLSFWLSCFIISNLNGSYHENKDQYHRICSLVYRTRIDSNYIVLLVLIKIVLQQTNTIQNNKIQNHVWYDKFFVMKLERVKTIHLW